MAMYKNSTSSDFINDTITVNYTSLYDQSSQSYKSFSQIASLVEVVLSILGVVFNVFVVCNLVYVRCRGSLKTSLQFVTNLAFCDGYFAFVHVLRKTFDMFTVWDIFYGRLPEHGQPLSPEQIVGLTFSYLYQVMQSVALATMMFIAVDLLILVKWPLRYAVLMAPRKGTLMIILAWVASFLVWACIVALCTPETMVYFGVTFLIANGLAMFVCFIVFVVIYVIVTCDIRRLIKRTPSRHSRSTVKSAITVACVLITYFICNMPIVWMLITEGIYFANGFTNRYGLLYIFDTVRCLFVLNSILDPLIYSVRLPELRKIILSRFNFLKQLAK